jgi:uncharacterized protein YutE (UPF0331/DUF86 family)
MKDVNRKDVYSESLTRRDVIRTKIKEIEESIQLVKDNLPDNFPDFSGLGLIKDGIYKRLEFAIESVFDICEIINSDLNLGIPTDDESILDNLFEAGVLKEEIREKLKSMKAFRNILVHQYGKVDDALAFQILNEHIDDFSIFVEFITDFLGNIR